MNKKSNDETMRDPKGKWMKGTPSPNPNGRPRRVVEAEALAALGEVWNTDELKEVARTVLSFAKAGNITAAITILKYQAGSPPENLNVSAMTGNELADLTDEQIIEILAGREVSSDDTDSTPALSAES